MTDYLTDIKNGATMDGEMLHNYLQSLVNRFFKILPIKENEPDSLQQYTESLQFELIGFKELIIAIKYDPEYMSLLSKLQYIIDHPDVTVKRVRREVFCAISICNKLCAKYCGNCNKEDSL